MKTLLGTEVTEDIRGVLYLCDYQGTSIKVIKEILSADAMMALNLFAEIPNPASQLATGNTFEELIKDLETLHNCMKDPEWLKELGNCL